MRAVPQVISRVRDRAKIDQMCIERDQLLRKVDQLTKRVDQLRHDVASKSNYVSKMWVALRDVPGAYKAMRDWKLSNPNGDDEDKKDKGGK